MPRLSLFNSPLLLGFDHFERALDRVSKVSTDGYPPYNIEQVSENALRISLAVAGFAMNDLKLTIEDNQLAVRGKQADEVTPSGVRYQSATESARYNPQWTSQTRRVADGWDALLIIPFAVLRTG